MKRLQKINKVMLALLLTMMSGTTFAQKIKIMGNVYGGGQQATVVGNTNVTLTNDKINIANSPTNDKDGAGTPDDRGRIYGGGAMADVKKPSDPSDPTYATTGNTNVTIKGGSIDGGIFGGGEGKIYDVAEGTHSIGDIVSANVEGNTNVTILGGELNPKWNNATNRFFYNCNIYGGGNVASTINGNTYVTMNKGMLSNNSDGSGTFLNVGTGDRFDHIYDALGIPQLCLFGAGLGINTNVKGNTYVDYNISFNGNKTIAEINKEVLDPLTGTNYDNQILIDVIGGGFNGTVEGETNVHVGGNSMCRDVYGGGFYNTVGGTNVLISSGNIDNVYGGGVIGGVTNNDGNAATNVQIGLKGANGTFNNKTVTYRKNNEDIAILNSVYGANDVSGTVNQANVTINGGKIYRNVYGAGNGEYEGYDEPGEHVAFNMGESGSNYKDVTANANGDTKVYNGRPVTNNIAINLGGQANDRAEVLGQVFGGGNSCTITDNGKLAVTLASHVSIGQKTSVLQGIADTEYLNDEGENVSGLFMGSSGAKLAEQPTNADDQYYHRYYDGTQYKLGFADKDQFDTYIKNILVKSDNVSINFADGAEDIWLANFVGGGFRGSMQTNSASGLFRYSLSRGVTVHNAIVGGSYDADITYDRDGDSTPEFTFAGGILNYNNMQKAKLLDAYNTNPENSITGEDQTNKLDFSHYTEDKYTTALPAFKDKALVLLDLQNMLEPAEYTDNSDTYWHGGNVFGGCYTSGNVQGDIWVDYRCFMHPSLTADDAFNLQDETFERAAAFADNGTKKGNFAQMLFGAGYGQDTKVTGDTYMRIMHQPKNSETGAAYGYPRLYNAFGGSYEGRVDGSTFLFYNAGRYGFLAGGLYGGGCNGYVSGKTFLEVSGGFVNDVFGGARNANIGGGTHVWTYDGACRPWAEAEGVAKEDAENAPLLIGRLFGGTDISGKICYTEDGNTYNESKGWTSAYSYSNWPAELTLNGTDAAGGLRKLDSYLQVGGTDVTPTGFPLIGQVFAGGNGELTDVANGQPLPDIKTTLMEITDGSIVYAFGGGNHATVTGQNYIMTKCEQGNVHDLSDLISGSVMYNVVKNRILSVAIDCYEEVANEQGAKELKMHDANVQRLFGGNNVADMSIQPKWNLINGYLSNVYSGGNMGRMTWFREDGATRANSSSVVVDSSIPNSNLTPQGLQINIDQPEIHIGSLFGGCRMADVIPGGFDTDGVTPLKKAAFEGVGNEDFYGATVNISDGYIENVYGGNDVSGTVYYGTNVNISGAVSGNVYGSGNGFYQYKWDDTFDWSDPTKNPNGANVVEDISSDGKIYYHVKPISGDPATTTTYGGDAATSTQKLLTINHYRPSVEKAFLNIAGLKERAEMGTPGTPGYKPAVERRVAYVKGNVYCGGNASTVLGTGTVDSYTKFKIGSYVTLNGVFMGSDGEAFSEDKHIKEFEELNGINMADSTNSPTDIAALGAGEQKFYPNLLSVYMQAVEMKAQPEDFNLNLPLKEAYIGTYCGGGNRGSMTVTKVVDLTFHHDIVIYDKIVAACFNSNVAYKKNENTTVKAWGGYLRPIADPANNKNKAGVNVGNTKMYLTIASQFAPLVMDVPADKEPGTVNLHGESFADAQAHDFLYANLDKNNVADVFNASSQYGVGCNIYGGCYNSGEVEGDVTLNIHSNMLRYANKEKYENSVANNIACFNVYGAGYGLDSHVWGNVDILMNKSTDESIMGTKSTDNFNKVTLNEDIIDQLGTRTYWDIQHDDTKSVLKGDFNDITDSENYPSVGSIFGGGRSGMLIGNAEIQVRNGLVYRDVTGGSFAADMYGSSQVIVGYPKYYRCKTSNVYHLTRGDKWNLDKKLDNTNNNPVLKQIVHYMQGDLVPANVWEQIKVYDTENSTDQASTANFELVTTDLPTSAPWNTTWDDIKIKIGGGVYGGGFSLTNSMSALAGSISTHKLSATKKVAANYYDPNRYLNFNGRYGLDIASIGTAGYGGNSSVMIGDNTDQIKSGTKDHVRISTLSYQVAKFNAADWVDPSLYDLTTDAGKLAYNTERAKTQDYNSVIGKFIKETVDGKEKFTHLGDGRPEKGKTYYTLSGEGGIYGDGHLVFCEGFRAADITGYGYAEGSPKHPILMNTFQRLDLVSLNDCCLMLQGAQDFATNQTDATIYSIARIDEMRMNSSLDATQELKQLGSIDGTADAEFDNKKVRNYLGFFNNVHFLGSLITNDPFQQNTSDGAIFHGENGVLETGKTYYQKKQDFIDAYSSATDKADATVKETFKKRNVGTARNAIGINNGYCLRIQNQCFREGEAAAGSTYYGPIVGVCEVKLLTLVEGEGGGYVYADNVHKDWVSDMGQGHDFLNVSGNFVFPGIVHTNAVDGAQYIIDDCFTVHYGTNADQTNGSPDQVVTVNGKQTNKKEAHYWFVEGNKYFFHTTLTGYTFTAHNNFDLIDNDPNILLSGLDSGYELQVKSVNWGASIHRDGYVDDLVANYTDPGRNSSDLVEALTPADGYTTSDAPYHFNMQVGRYKDVNDVLHQVWNDDMSRETNLTERGKIAYTVPDGHEDVMPVFNVTLSDNVDNAPKDLEQNYYEAHLNEPDIVKIVLYAKHPTDPNAIEYTYTITMNVVYMQGPSFTGGPVIENCILPGEILKFSSEGVQVHTTDQLPLTSYSWKIVKPVAGFEGIKWQTDEISGSANNPIPLDPSLYELVGEHLEGHMKGYYYQNGWNIAYIFTAGGHDFAVLPIQDPEKDASQRMFVVHNYQRMYKEDDLKVPMATDARVYIEEEKDMKAFLTALKGQGTEGQPGYVKPYDFAKQRVFMMADFDLTSSAYTGYDLSVLKSFKGVFDGFGHSLTVPVLNTSASTLIGHNDASIRKLFGDNIRFEGKPSITKLTDAECHEHNVGHLVNDIHGVAPGANGYLITYEEGFIPWTTNDEKERIGSVVNLLVLDGSADENDDDYKYGKMAYDLNKFYLDRREDSFDNTDSYTRKFDYVEDYFKNGDYQYAGIKSPGNPFLRTGENNYDSYDTHHDATHTHDLRRWNGDHNVPLYEVDYATSDTYDANHDHVADNHGDFNDYIYFGQKIVKGSRGSYALDEQRPYAIKKNEADVLYNGAVFNNMNDRVFLAEGYYQSKENKGFYHNKEAVVINPKTTAVGFGPESMTMDQPEKGITSFDVDSNKDYDANYSNDATGHVTQNLLVYTNKADNSSGAFVAGHYADNTKESEVRYHAIDFDGTNNVIANMHLVDKQDFNAPKEFTVTNRAWYERLPIGYRNNHDGDGHFAFKRWEGITLPFTAKKVTAALKADRVGDANAVPNGEISHFYGNSELHHEYWLRGLVDVTNGSDIDATFARPGTSATAANGAKLFAQTQEHSNYVYTNEYFANLFGYDINPEYGEWYQKAMTDGQNMEDYVYLTKDVPYIVAFPGDDYYEFSMEGDEMYDVTGDLSSYDSHQKLGSGQIAVFEASDAAILVSDDQTRITTAGDYDHIGTFMHKNDAAYTMTDEGESFDDTNNTVVPFRTYMQQHSSPVKNQGTIYIVEGDIEGDEPNSPEEDFGEGTIRGLAFSVDGLTVSVENGYENDKVLRVYTTAGQLVLSHVAPQGQSSFRLPKDGLYIINNKKVMARPNR